MSYKIVFKGGLEPIYVDDDRGANLMTKKQNGELDGDVSINGSLYDSKSIKAILQGESDPDSNEKKNEFTEMIEAENRSFKEWRRQRLLMPPKERAESVSFMNYMSQALRGRPLTHNEIQEVKQKQEEFFTEHPDFHTANPTCFFQKNDLILEGEENLPMLPIQSALKLNALKYAERHLNAF